MKIENEYYERRKKLFEESKEDRKIAAEILEKYANEGQYYASLDVLILENIRKMQDELKNLRALVRVNYFKKLKDELENED